MPGISAVRLLDVEPDIAQFLSREELDQASGLTVPMHSVPRSPLDLVAVLEEASAFGALVLDGLLVERMRLADHTAMRLIGPGEILTRGAPRSMMLAQLGCRAAAATRLAMLGNEILIAAHRWPRILTGLHIRMAEQAERLATQLVICQLPRVEDRLLAVMWLLAESWGQVTAAGTVLPLTLTHDALGELIGARRPTVTLALRELSERGALLRHERGWLLLEAVPEPMRDTTMIDEPRLIEDAPSPWSVSQSDQIHEGSRRELHDAVGRLREEHQRNVDRFAVSLERIAAARERSKRKWVGVAGSRPQSR